MPKRIFLGEWLAQMEKVPAYRRMSALENGKLILKPRTFLQRRWAEAIKSRLNKDGFENVSIVG
ncbi:MAG: hypothetical protein WDA59_07235 [Methanofastidiosum sp.]